MNVVRQVIEPMYECKPDIEINELIAKRLGLDWGRHGMSDMDVMKIQWSKTKLPDAYKQINPDMKLPTFEEMLEEANLQLPTPPEKSVIESAKYAPGEFPTDTGKINFYSPSLLLAAACRTVLPVHSTCALPKATKTYWKARRRLLVAPTRCSSRRRICPIVLIRRSTTRP